MKIVWEGRASGFYRATTYNFKGMMKCLSKAHFSKAIRILPGDRNSLSATVSISTIACRSKATERGNIY